MVEHQHIILRKYAMTGMISYADAPAFHDLVDKRDYRIICCYEVFCMNRSEDDFLENLAILAQIVKEQDGNLMLINSDTQSPVSCCEEEQRFENPFLTEIK